MVEVDVQKFFDSIPRTTLRDSIARRVTDGVVRRLIDKWLKAGKTMKSSLENGTLKDKSILLIAAFPAKDR